MPRLPSSSDVPKVTPIRDPGARTGGSVRVPGVQVPRTRVPEPRVPSGAFDPGLGAAAEEFGPGLEALAEAARKQEKRQATVDRADKINTFRQESTQELQRLNVEADLSDEKTLQEYGQFLTSRRQELISEHDATEESQALLSIRLQEIESQVIGEAAGVSTKIGREKVRKVFNDRLNPLLQQVNGDPTRKSIDRAFVDLEREMEDLKGAFDPSEEEELRQTGREDIVLGALNSAVTQGNVEQAELLASDPDVFNTLSPENQRTIINRINTVKRSRADAVMEAEKAFLVESAKLRARRENINTILSDANAEPIGDPAVGESPATVTPFGEGVEATEDMQDASRLFAASRRLMAAGETQLASGMLSQARFIVENSPQIQREQELDKPISEDLASEFGVPVGTTMRQVMGMIPASPEEISERRATGTARGRGRVKAEEQITFIDEASTMLSDLLEEVDEDPTIVGVGGTLRATGQTALGVLGDLGMDSLVESARDLAFENTDLGLDEINNLFESETLSSLGILENSIGLILARLRTPTGRIPVDVIKRSIDDVQLTGLRGSKQVQNRLKFVMEQLNRRSSAIEQRFELPGREQEEDNVPRFVVKDGKLVPAGE